MSDLKNNTTISSKKTTVYSNFTTVSSELLYRSGFKHYNFVVSFKNIKI